MLTPEQRLLGDPLPVSSVEMGAVAHDGALAWHAEGLGFDSQHCQIISF